MLKLFRRWWAYLTAKGESSFNERADPKIQLEQAILEAQDPRKDLPCTANQIKPQLGFDMKFHGGYEVSIPLREPFVIATGRIDTTRAALVRATLEDEGGRRATGLGEAAALPPVTRRVSPSASSVVGSAAGSGKVGSIT